MARYSDEAWEYIQDCKEKKSLGNNARHKIVNSGRRGGMKTAMDYMSKKQLRAMDGEVQTYRLGSPMGWEVFSAMPDDLKKMYIKKLRDKFKVPDAELAVAMGVDIQKFADCLDSIALSPRPGMSYVNGYNWYATDDYERFVTWWGITKEEK